MEVWEFRDFGNFMELIKTLVTVTRTSHKVKKKIKSGHKNPRKTTEN